MKTTYRFVGLEMQYGRQPDERILRHGDLIELTEQERVEAVEGGAAFEPVGQASSLTSES